jgi:hypothetical protein
MRRARRGAGESAYWSVPATGSPRTIGFGSAEKLKSRLYIILALDSNTVPAATAMKKKRKWIKHKLEPNASFPAISIKNVQHGIQKPPKES